MRKYTKNNSAVAATTAGVKKTRNKKPLYSNSSQSQRARILEWFQKRSPRLSTPEARDVLGIMSPASRIHELRKLGHRIVTYRVELPDSNGVLHQCGQYVYFGQDKKIFEVARNESCPLRQ